MHLRVLPNGELIAHAVLVIDLIAYAYNLPSNPLPRLNSPPDWIYRDRYDIDAKASPNAVTTTSPDGEIQVRVKQMFRRLLAARFRTRDAGGPPPHSSLCADHLERRPPAATFDDHRERLHTRYFRPRCLDSPEKYTTGPTTRN